MFFILYGLYLSGMFFNEKGMLAGLFVSRVEPTPRSKSLVSLGQTFHLPATGPAAFPRRSTFLTPLTEAGMRWVRSPCFIPLLPQLRPNLAPRTSPRASTRLSAAVLTSVRFPEARRRCPGRWAGWEIGVMGSFPVVPSARLDGMHIRAQLHLRMIVS